MIKLISSSLAISLFVLFSSSQFHLRAEDVEINAPTIQQYFPKGLFDSEHPDFPGGEITWRKYFSDAMRENHEEPLKQYAGNSLVFRLASVHLGQYESIRITIDRKERVLIHSILYESNDCSKSNDSTDNLFEQRDTKTDLVTRSYEVSSKLVEQILVLINSQEFSDAPVPSEKVVWDGVDYLFEVLWSDNNYLAIIEQSPERGILNSIVNEVLTLRSINTDNFESSITNRESIWECEQ